MKKHKIQKSPLYVCNSKKYLAERLSNWRYGVVLSAKDFRSVEHHFLKDNKVFYQHKISKERFDIKPPDYNTKVYRKFVNPSRKLKATLKKLNYYLGLIETPKYLHSKSRRSFKTNAVSHKGNIYYYHMDIKSFYPNTQFKYVKSFFLAKDGFNMSNAVDVAVSLAMLCTLPEDGKKSRSIPQGYPTSVLLSYFAYKRMFDELNAFAIRKNMVFTTYVDDITFSSKIEIPFEEMKNEVAKILEKYGHKLKKQKVLFKDVQKNQDPIITGVLVKRHKVRASKKLHTKMIRLFRKHRSLIIIDEQRYIKSWKWFNSLTGLLNSIDYIEPSKTMKKRDAIRVYVEHHKKDYLLNISISKIEKLGLERDLYLAYKYNTLKDFYNINKTILLSD